MKAKILLHVVGFFEVGKWLFRFGLVGAFEF